MVVTDRSDLAERIRLLRSHGMTSLSWDRHQASTLLYDVVELGYNYRIDEMRAALGIAQLEKLEENNRRRRELTDIYRTQLADLQDIRLPFLGHPGDSSAHLFPILLDNSIDRVKFMATMADQKVQTSVHYPPIHQFQHYRNSNSSRCGKLVVTEGVASRIVTLPLFPQMTNQDVETVVNAVESAVRKSSESDSVMATT